MFDIESRRLDRLAYLRLRTPHCENGFQIMTFLEPVILRLSPLRLNCNVKVRKLFFSNENSRIT